MCGGSPLFYYKDVCVHQVGYSDVGEIHRGDYNYLYSRSPLCFCFLFVFCFVVVFNVGEITQERRYNYTLILPSITLVLPLSEPV